MGSWRRLGVLPFITAALAALVLFVFLQPKALRVIDGDTFDSCSLILCERIRIENIDAPEVGSAKCAYERQRAKAARRALSRLIADQRVQINRIRLDRYGRTLALVSVEGHDVGKLMIDLGHAVAWGTGKPNWCST